MVPLDDAVVKLARERLHKMVDEMLDGPREWAVGGMASVEHEVRFTGPDGESFAVSCKLDLDPEPLAEGEAYDDGGDDLATMTAGGRA